MQAPACPPVAHFYFQDVGMVCNVNALHCEAHGTYPRVRTCSCVTSAVGIIGSLTIMVVLDVLMLLNNGSVYLISGVPGDQIHDPIRTLSALGHMAPHLY